MTHYEKEHGTCSWGAAGGPSPENIGPHRLCEDTCNEGGSVSPQHFQAIAQWRGEYAKGRQREFKAWRQEDHKDELFIPLERAMGNRQDFKFDGRLLVAVLESYEHQRVHVGLIYRLPKVEQRHRQVDLYVLR